MRVILRAGHRKHILFNASTGPLVQQPIHPYMQLRMRNYLHLPGKVVSSFFLVFGQNAGTQDNEVVFQ